MSKVNPHFSEKTYLRMALEGASDIPNNPTTRQMEALVGAGEGSGGGGGSKYVIAHTVETDDGFRLDMTWQEIHDAIAAETIVYINHAGPNFDLAESDSLFCDVEYVDNVMYSLELPLYAVDIIKSGTALTLQCLAPEAYPEGEEGGGGPK